MSRFVLYARGVLLIIESRMAGLIPSFAPVLQEDMVSIQVFTKENCVIEFLARIEGPALLPSSGEHWHPYLHNNGGKASPCEVTVFNRSQRVTHRSHWGREGFMFWLPKGPSRDMSLRRTITSNLPPIPGLAV